LDSTQRYSLQKAKEYILKALIKLNKVHGLNITLLDLDYVDYSEYLFAWPYDQNVKYKFIGALAESLFTATGNAQLADIDAPAKIESKNLDDESKTILRVAYVI
jgi:hypothetical protein